MRHRKKLNHLGRTSSHRKAMLANMASSLILHKRISTTVAKAKALRIYVEPLITKSKTDSTHSRRMVFSYLKDKQAVSELFREVSPKIADRPGGYTRILKTGSRLGDNADMCIIELVDYNENMLAAGREEKPAAKRRRRGRGKKAEQATPAAAAQQETAEEQKPEAGEMKKEQEAAAEEKKEEAVAEEKKEEAAAEGKKEEAVAEEKKEEAADEEKKDKPEAEEPNDEPESGKKKEGEDDNPEGNEKGPAGEKEK
jgi:large subunit ribosomal protein L17